MRNNGCINAKEIYTYSVTNKCKTTTYKCNVSNLVALSMSQKKSVKDITNSLQRTANSQYGSIYCNNMVCFWINEIYQRIYQNNISY